MRRRFAVAAVVAALPFVGLSSAVSSSGKSDVIPLLRVGLPISVSSLDNSKSSAGEYVAMLGLETLMKIDKNGKVVPWLAKSVSQPTSTVYTYHLRRGVKFWNGNELTAFDVANSLNYQRRPGSQAAFAYASVKSIKPIGNYTVRVTLKNPDPNWNYIAGEWSTAIFEKKFQRTHRGTFGQPGTLVMGTGPWKITSLDPTVGAELTANPNWWGGEVPIKRISFKFFSSETSEALAFRGGDIDVIPYSISDATGFSSAAGTKLLTVPSLGLTYFTMNVGVAPWNDVHVRRAAAYAIDRTLLAKAIGGLRRPVTTFIPPSMLATISSPAQAKALVGSLPQYPTSLEKAKAELAKSAYPNGFTYTLNEPANLSTIAQAFAGQLKPIGIDLQVKVVPTGEFFKQVVGPPLERPTMVVGGGATSPDPSGFDWALGSKNTEPGGYNIANYKPPAVDILIAKGKSTADPIKRLAIYKSLLTRLGTDVPYVPLFTGYSVYALSSNYKWNNLSTYSLFNGTWALDITAKA